MILIDHEYRIVELTKYGMPTKVREWMIEKFGDQCDGRWFYRHPNIYFADSKDHLMFVLRWA